MTERVRSIEAPMELRLLDDSPIIIIRPVADSWGWLPALSLISAVGIFLLALAYNAARVASLWAYPLFWSSMLVLFLPIAWRLLLSRPARQERLTLLILLGIALYFAKFLQYPLYFTYYDEFLHWRTAQDIAISGHLFHENPLLPISSFYPGLEIVTSALSSLTGLSLFVSGIVVIGVVRLVFVLVLYLFYEHLSNSARVAGVATLLYMANSNFVFFDGQFAYESLALPLAVFVLFAVAYRSSTPASHHKGLTLVILLGLGAVVITHHITSYVLVAFLFLWTIASFLQRHNQKAQANPGGIALLGLVLSGAWLLYTGDNAVGYLLPHFSSTVDQIIQILSSERAPRHLFQGSTGPVTPLWERATTYASVALILLGLPFGLFRIWQHHRTNKAVLVLAAGALAYPASQILRFTEAGAEAADRATGFLFLGIAFVLAIGAMQLWLSRVSTWRQSVILISALCIIFFGQLITGILPSWSALPGPYLVSADQRSIEPEGITAAEWARSYLGPGQRLASDRINTLLMATYGNEQAVTAGVDEIPISPVFTLLRFGPDVEAILQQDKIQYLVVDHRLSTALPATGTYFNKPASGEEETKPIDQAALAKFDGVKNVSRLFDSGDIIIYDVEPITSGLSTTPTPTGRSLSYPEVAKRYTGTILDIPTGLTTAISFTDIQQQQANISGHLRGISMIAPFSGIPVISSFKGTITSTKKLQLIVISDTGTISFFFYGVMLPDGSIAGTYCIPEQITGACSDYGLWSASPGA
jgi:hypothetical protein